METSPEKLGAHAGVVSFGAGATTKPGKRGLTKEYGSPGQLDRITQAALETLELTVPDLYNLGSLGYVACHTKRESQM